MENQSSKNSQKAKLPPLFSGSEYKTDDSDKYRAMNLLGTSIAIVVNANKDEQKKAWLKLFEEEYKKTQLHYKKTINFKARHSSNITPIPDNTLHASPIYKMIHDWLKKSINSSPDWDGLYTLIKIRIPSLGEDSSTEWWNKVKFICMKTETTDFSFDPIAEILKLSENYPAENDQYEEPPQDIADDKKSTSQTKDLTIKERFTFETGQVLFDGKDLEINTGDMQEVLKKLVQNYGRVVKFTILDENGNSSDKEASTQLRNLISDLRKKLKSLPVKIENRRRNGYILLSDD